MHGKHVEVSMKGYFSRRFLRLTGIEVPIEDIELTRHRHGRHYPFEASVHGIVFFREYGAPDGDGFIKSGLDAIERLYRAREFE